jgi:hypothetical protein
MQHEILKNNPIGCFFFSLLFVLSRYLLKFYLLQFLHFQKIVIYHLLNTSLLICLANVMKCMHCILYHFYVAGLLRYIPGLHYTEDSLCFLVLGFCL